MPVYNGEEFIANAIESILGQSYTNLELVICDNASLDSTWEICNRYSHQDNRVRMFANTVNIGAAANYNRVVQESTGEFFKWATHDDFCSSDFLSECISAFNCSSVETVICYGQTVLVDKDGGTIAPYNDNMELYESRAASRLLRLCRALRMCNVVMGLIRRDALVSTRLIGPFPSADKVLLAELAMRGMFRFVPKATYFRRLHAASSIRQNTSASTLAGWYAPTASKGGMCPRTRLLWEHLKAVARAPLNVSERAHCLAAVLAERVFLNRQWRVLGGEVRSAYFGPLLRGRTAEKSAVFIK